jgi:HSP20 family protein
MYTPTLNSVLDRMLALSRVVDDSFVERAIPAYTEFPVREQLWLPLLDVYQTEKAFVIEADLAGVHPENVDISYEKGMLTISGTRGPTLPAKETKEKEKAELRVFTAERMIGSFSRSIRLPEQVDPDKIEANFALGVLTVTVPKLPSALPKKITVKVSESVKALKG